MWTQFWDMRSGGTQKEPYRFIYIEADTEEAIVIFYNRFGHNPKRVTCTCCGEDYSIDANKSLAQLTGHHRGCRNLEHPRDPETGLYKKMNDPVWEEHYYLEKDEEPPAGYKVDESRLGSIRLGSKFKIDNCISVEEYVKQPDVLVIYEADILPEWRKGEVPEQGYVWKD